MKIAKSAFTFDINSHKINLMILDSLMSCKIFSPISRIWNMGGKCSIISHNPHESYTELESEE